MPTQPICREELLLRERNWRSERLRAHRRHRSSLRKQPPMQERAVFLQRDLQPDESRSVHMSSRRQRMRWSIAVISLFALSAPVLPARGANRTKLAVLVLGAGVEADLADNLT